MRLGAITCMAVAALGLLSVLITVTDVPEDVAPKIEQRKNNFAVYDTKKMYIEAASELKAITQLDPESYEAVIEYKDYCLKHGLTKEFTAACEKAMAMKPDDPQPAEDYLEHLAQTDSKQIYTFVKQKIETMKDEDKQFFMDYYDTIKGRYKTLSGKFSIVSPWSNDYILIMDEDGSMSLRGGTSVYAFAEDENGKTCVMTDSGSVNISSEYDRIYSYSPSNAYISVEDEKQIVYVDYNSNRKIVPYDPENKTLVDYEYLGAYYSGVANYCRDGVWGYINTAPYPVVAGYKHATPFSNGIAAVQDESGKWAFVKYSAEDGFSRLTDFDYTDVYIDTYGFPFSYGYCYVKSGVDKWRLAKITFNEEGALSGVQTVGELSFDDVRPFGVYGAVCVGEKWGFIDGNGNWILEPAYDDAFSFSCGLAPVKTGDKWGYIDAKGKNAIGADFDEALSFSQKGIAAVKQDNMWRYIQLLEYKYKE